MKTLTTATAVIEELRRAGSPRSALVQQKYFRTGPGEYGEGDKFFGMKVAVYRGIGKRAKDLSEKEIAKLLASPWHEARATGLTILTERAEKAGPSAIKKISSFYWKNRKGINNWDLVDLSAPTVMGRWLSIEFEKSPAAAKAWIRKTVRSKNLWERRIAVLATYHLIRQNKHDLTLLACADLLKDDHDLIHKATGWMLRETGKRSEKHLDLFLKKHAHEMPRTMLRYSIERKSRSERNYWMGRKEDFRNSGRKG